MNAQSKIEAGNPLEQLRAPFPANQISKLPKESRAQADERKSNRSSAVNCKVCGGWHHKNAVHLDYVGHAAATDRLLDTDLEWDWEPFAVDQRGLPAFDETGGLWIRLTVCGKTRIGYGSADGKTGGDAKKEIIGDAIRNAGMRFGMALDLWHKGDLHADESIEETAAPSEQDRAKIDDNQWGVIVQLIEAKGADTRAFCEWMGVKSLRDIPACDFIRARDALNKKRDKAPNPQRDEVLADEIPY